MARHRVALWTVSRGGGRGAAGGGRDDGRPAAHQTGEQLYEAELHQLMGELLLQSSVRSPTSNVETRGLGTPPGASEAEACFRQALDVARRQQAKSLELRAAMSLSRLWQQPGSGHLRFIGDGARYSGVS